VPHLRAVLRRATPEVGEGKKAIAWPSSGTDSTAAPSHQGVDSILPSFFKREQDAAPTPPIRDSDSGSGASVEPKNDDVASCRESFAAEFDYQMLSDTDREDHAVPKEKFGSCPARIAMAKQWRRRKLQLNSNLAECGYGELGAPARPLTVDVLCSIDRSACETQMSEEPQGQSSRVIASRVRRSILV
jgi:hypothetical protein